MDEDEDTRLIAEYPDYPVAVVPTQSSRTAELCWVNNKITLGSKPVKSQTNRGPALNPGSKVNIDKVCEHCNVEFANNALLINHLLSLFSSAKKTVKRKTEKPKAPKKFRLSKKFKVGDKVLKRKQYSKVSEDNCKGKNQSQVNPSTSKNVHSMQQTSSTNASTSENKISKKNSKVRFSFDNDEDSGKVQKSHKCEQCSLYFGNLNMLLEHSVEHTVKKKKLDHKIPNLKAKKKTMPKIERNKAIPASNTLSCRPEIKKSISVQNKSSSRKECDTIDQTKTAVNSPSKKVTDSKPASKNRPSKKIKKVTAFNNHGPNHPTVKVINSEKTELFKSNCGLHFISYKSVQKHSDVCNGCCDTPKLKCKKCRYLFPSDTLGIHQSKHHNNNQINIFDVVELSQKRDSKLQCKSCTQNFKYKKSYQQHVLKCTYKIKPQNLSYQKMLYKCVQCNIYYTSQAGLKFHLQKNHLIRYAIKKCDDCDILLSNRSFEHHIQIHHNLFECELKDLTINSNEGQVISPKTQTKKSVRHSLVSKDNSSLDKNVTNENFSAGSNILRGDKFNEDNILIAKNLSKEIPHNPTDILPNIQYKCNKCDVHFPTNRSLKNHVSSKNCLDSISNETEKCPKCHLLFNTENIIEHVANYHLEKFKTSNDNKISSPKTQTNKTPCHSLVIKNNSSFNESMTNENLTDSTESNVVRGEKVNESKISMTNNINKEIPNKLTDILYKCDNCNVHFPTNSAYKDHVSSKNCPDSISNETEKCPKCQLVFYTESVIEHIANQHLDKFNSSNNYIIMCNDTPEIESLTMTGNDNKNAKKDHIQITKSLNIHNNNEELALRKSSEPNVQSLTVYDKAESVKLFAEAWIRNKCTEISNFVNVDLDSYSNFLYRCHNCTLNFLNLGRLKLHESECNGDSFEWAQCPICYYSFNLSSLTLHMYVHHATMELKRENFVLKSSEFLKNSPNIACSVASDHIMAANKQSSTKETQNLVQKDSDQTKRASFLDKSEVIDDIKKRVSKAEKYIDLNTKLSDITVNDLDSAQGSKDKHLSEFKSSRAKIAWAIDSIEDSSRYCDQKSQQEFNEELKETFKENGTPKNRTLMDLPNDKIVIKTSTIVNNAFNVKEKVVSQEIYSILSALDGKSNGKPNHDSIFSSYQTDTGEDIQTNKAFEDMDSLVASLNKNSKASKLQEKNIVLYKCNICSIHFMTSKSLQMHTLNDAHKKDLGTNCNICHLTFKKNTITRHVTNHHEKNNFTSLNYIIKTDFRCDSTTMSQKVVSDYFNENQKKIKYAKEMIHFTQQKSSASKVLKSFVKNKTIAKKATDSSINTQNTILKLLLADCENEKQQVVYSTIKDSHSQHTESNKADNLNEPKNSNPNNLGIIDFSNLRNLKVGGDKVTCPVTSQLMCTNYAQHPSKRTFSVDSNITKYENPTNLPKSRTKSQDNHSSHSSKQDKININTGMCDQNEKRTKIFAENLKTANKESGCKTPPHLQLDGINNIMPKEIVDVDSNAKQDSVIHHTSQLYLNLLKTCNDNNMGFSEIMQPPPITLNKVVSFERIEIMNDTAENQNKNMFKNISQTTFPEPTVSKTSTKEMGVIPDETRTQDVYFEQSCPKSMGVEKRTDTSCVQKFPPPHKTFVAFEDSNFEIRPSYGNYENVVMHTADKVNVEVSKKQEESGRKIGDKHLCLSLLGNSLRSLDRNEFPNSDASSTGKSTNTYQNYPVDIIDITDETINYNTVTQGTNSNKTYSAEHNIPLNMTVEKDRTAFDGWPNRRPTTSTIGARVPTNTPMVLPSAPNFDLFNFLDDPFLRFLNQPFHQQSRFNNNSNHTNASPKQSKTRVTKNHSVPRVPNIFDSMKWCPICKCSDRISSIKHHLKVKKGFFSCCYCSRKAADSKLIDHVQICGSQVNFNTYS